MDQSPNKRLQQQQILQKAKSFQTQPQKGFNNKTDLNIDKLDERWKELKIQGVLPNRRSYHSMSIYKGHLIIYGGYQQELGLLEDFYKLKVVGTHKYEWKEILYHNNTTSQSFNKQSQQSLISQQSKNILSDLPGKRLKHCSIVKDDELFIFGGQNTSTSNTNLMHSFDFQKSMWKLIHFRKNEFVPPPIDSFGSVLYDNNLLIILCGFEGGNQSSYSNNVYSYNIQNNQWQILFNGSNLSGKQKQQQKHDLAPRPRGSTCATLIKNNIFLFGGQNTSRKFNDLWQFNLDNNLWSEIQVQGDIIPTVRNGHTLISYKSYLFLFGGIEDVTKEKNDVFLFSTQTNIWKQVHVNTSSLPVINQQQQRSNSKKKLRSEKKMKTQAGVSPTKLYNAHTGQRNNQQSGISPYQRRSKISPDISPLKQIGTNLIKSQGINKNKFDISNYNSGDSPNSQYPQQQTTNFLDEKKKQQLLLDKKNMLAALQLKDVTNIDFEKEKDDFSPTSLRMYNSLIKIGNQVQDKQKSTWKNLSNQISQRKIKNTNYNQESNNDIENTSNLQQNTQVSNQDENQEFKDIFRLENNQLIGKKPTGRDGQSMLYLQDGVMVIFGGDRHLMSFNDTFLFDLDMCIANKYQLDKISQDDNEEQSQSNTKDQIISETQGEDQISQQITNTENNNQIQN